LLVDVPGVPGGALGTVVGTVDRLPIVGTSGLLADASSLASLMAVSEAGDWQPNEFWLASQTPDAVAEQARRVTSRPAEFRTAASFSNGPVLAVGSAFGWIGAGVALALVVVGFAGVAAGLHRDRLGELLPLRSLGLGAGRQGRSRAIELGLTALASIGLGIGVGSAAAAFALQAIPGGGEVAAGVAGAAPGLGVLAVALGLVAVFSGLRVRAAALRGVER
jgi:hypothetical protein